MHVNSAKQVSPPTQNISMVSVQEELEPMDKCNLESVSDVVSFIGTHGKSASSSSSYLRFFRVDTVLLQT